MTVELGAQNGWSNLTLKCYANTFVKVDARIEVECRQTISYLKGYSYLKKQSNQKLTANIVSTIRRTTLCWVRGNIKELLFIKLTLYLSPLFWKQILTKQNIASTKNSQEFLASQVPVLKRNKATNSTACTEPSIFQLQWKRLYLIIYLSFLDLPHGIRMGSLPPAGNKLRWRQIWQSSYSSHWGLQDPTTRRQRESRLKSEFVFFQSL